MDIEPGMIALILMIDPKQAKEKKKKEGERRDEGNSLKRTNWRLFCPSLLPIV